MFMSTSLRNASLFLILLLAAPAASAQVTFGQVIDPLSQMIEYNQQETLRRTFEEHNRAFAARGEDADGSSNSQPLIKPEALEYQYDPATSAKVDEYFINELLKRGQAKGISAEDEATIRKMAGWDVVNTMRSTIKDKGGNPNSLADVMAIWLLISYDSITQSKNNADTSGLVKQLQTTISQDARYVSMSNADKQTMADTLLWMTFMNIYLRAEAGNDSAKLAKAAEYARGSLHEMGLNPDAFRITNSGLQLN